MGRNASRETVEGHRQDSASGSVSVSISPEISSTVRPRRWRSWRKSTQEWWKAIRLRLLGMAQGLVHQGIRFQEHDERLLREVLHQARQGLGAGGCRYGLRGVPGFGSYLQKSQLTGRRDSERVDLLPGDLGLRIEFPERLELVTEELEAHRPWRAHGPEIDDSAAPGEFALPGHLGLRLVALFLEPFDEIQRVAGIAPGKRTNPVGQSVATERQLLEGGHRGDDRTLPLLGIGQRHEGFQALTHDVDVRQLLLGGQDVPGREKPGAPGRSGICRTVPFRPRLPARC